VLVSATASQKDFGGRQTRLFQIGEGLAVNLHLRDFNLLDAHVLPQSGVFVPDGMNLYFAWSDTPPRTTERLVNAFQYPAGSPRWALPEGTVEVVFEQAGNLTWTMTGIGGGGTFVQGVAAGEVVPALWGTFTYSVATPITAILRPF
jgi:hypothetical protein